MIQPLTVGSKRVAEASGIAALHNEGFRVVCERLGVDLDELNDVVDENTGRCSSVPEALLRGILIGYTAREEEG
jgi:hypothetical protein